MATPQTPYDAVLHAARDVTRLDCALDAEMLGTALLGSVYAIAEEDRDAAVREFVGGFLAATTRRRTAAATTIRLVFATLVPDAAGAAAVKPGAQAPSWSDQLGRVRLTGSYAYGDVYGDQTSYLATFAYDDGDVGRPGARRGGAGRPQHRHHQGRLRRRSRPSGSWTRSGEMCADDELTWFREEDPRAAARRGGPAPERSPTAWATCPTRARWPPTGRWSARGWRCCRHRRWPRSTSPSRCRRDERTRPGPRVPRLARRRPGSGWTRCDGGDLASLHFCLSLVLDHAATFPDADPMRWSPAVAGLFLLDWVHRRAVLDMDDAAMLPRVVRGWAATRPGGGRCPSRPSSRPTRRSRRWCRSSSGSTRTGERRSPATAAVAQLMADGVDPNDPDALEAWIEANRHRLGDDPS